MMRKPLPCFVCALLLVLAMLTPSVRATETNEWTLRKSANYSGDYGEAITGAGDFVYLIREDSANSYFQRYNTSTDQWEACAQPGIKCRTGTVLIWDNGDYVYALMGNSDSTTYHYFYRYSISGNSWVSLADTLNEQGEGDAATWVKIDASEYIYATTGGEQRTTKLERYSISNGTWEYLTSPPSGMGDGAAMIWDGSNFLYMLQGEYQETTPLYGFWRYSISSDTWTELAQIPAYSWGGGSGGVGDGGSLVYPGLWDSSQADFLYALSGNQCYPETPLPIYDNRFYRYTISTNSWELLAETPYSVGYYVGCRLAYAGDDIYWWQGSPSTVVGNGNAFARYSAAPPTNHAPTLTSGYVSPTSGTVGMSFTYEVTYTDADGDAPSYIQVYIDGALYSMTKISGTYTGGALYRYTTSSLSASSHTYYFEASDGQAGVRLPTSGSYSGPVITEVVNSPPTLTSGSVSPGENVTGSIFTYTVTYADADGNTPSYVKVYVDGTEHSMAKISGTYASGAVYQWSTSDLNVGSHTYRFGTSDSTDTTQLPTSGSYSGPTVTEELAPTVDADNDGMLDTWENQYGLNPNTNDAAQDKDRDGYTNLQEYQAGTNPSLASSYPGFTGGDNVPDGEGAPPVEGIPITYVAVGAVAIIFTVLALVFYRKSKNDGLIVPMVLSPKI